jgi:hypothetical protein
MKIKRKDLLNWIKENKTINYKNQLYKVDFNVMYYMLRAVNDNHNVIEFYEKSRGIWGLSSNK